MTNQVIDTPAAIAPIIGFVLPLLVATVTNWSTSSKVKGILLGVLSLLTSIVAQVIQIAHDNEHLGWHQVLQIVLSALLTWVVGHSTYKSLWKNLGLTDKLKASFTKPAPVLPDGAFDVTMLKPINNGARVAEVLHGDDDPDGSPASMNEVTGQP